MARAVHLWTLIHTKLSLRLAELVPGGLNTFFHCVGGAEANKNAIKAARMFTGRHKILVRYRSYHGATNGASRSPTTRAASLQINMQNVVDERANRHS
jgi:4-aminobutyrate aminotransferase-like enzyme